MNKQPINLLGLLCIATLGPCTAFAAATHARPPAASRGVIPKLTGSIDPKNAERFLSQVTDRLDKIVGLQIRIAPSTDADFKKYSYFVSNESEPFSLSKGPSGETGGGVEMVAPRSEVHWLHGGWVIDGFYLVKSGGVHQGTVSVGLEKVSEASVLLSPKFRVVTRPVEHK